MFVMVMLWLSFTSYLSVIIITFKKSYICFVCVYIDLGGIVNLPVAPGEILLM